MGHSLQYGGHKMAFVIFCDFILCFFLCNILFYVQKLIEHRPHYSLLRSILTRQRLGNFQFSRLWNFYTRMADLKKCYVIKSVYFDTKNV